MTHWLIIVKTREIDREILKALFDYRAKGVGVHDAVLAQVRRNKRLEDSVSDALFSHYISGKITDHLIYGHRYHSVFINHQGMRYTDAMRWGDIDFEATRKCQLNTEIKNIWEDICSHQLNYTTRMINDIHGFDFDVAPHDISRSMVAEAVKSRPAMRLAVGGYATVSDIYLRGGDCKPVTDEEHVTRIEEFFESIKPEETVIYVDVHN